MRFFLFLLLMPLASGANTQLEQDKEAIRSLVGTFRVTFDFAETFSPDSAYHYHDRYHEYGTEYVFIVEETPVKISLQHLLIVNDTIVIKHWRQDWVYENTTLYSYYKDNEWKKITLTPEQAAGTWTQKVFQVDDSPRFEGYGTWVHADGKHYWESVCDAPLPRREYTTRNDYNVLRRHNRIELTAEGWSIGQDNEKIDRSDSADKLVCWEKGMEKFTRGNYNCQAGISWWKKQEGYWKDVRLAWTEVYSNEQNLELKRSVDGKSLYLQLFALGDKLSASGDYNSRKGSAAIRSLIADYIEKE